MGNCLVLKKSPLPLNAVNVRYNNVVESGSAYSVNYVWDSTVTPSEGLIIASVKSDAYYGYTTYLDGSSNNSSWTNNLTSFPNSNYSSTSRMISYSGYRYFRLRGSNSAGSGGPQYIHFVIIY